jgi:hypothetical protein
MARFAFDYPEQLIDFAYRSYHETTLKAKALVRALYGKPPERSYWIGCSSGGYEGLMEAQRFPEDFDGALRREDQSERHSDGRRLAGPVRPEESVQRPFGNVEVEVIDGRDLAVSLGEVLGCDGVQVSSGSTRASEDGGTAPATTQA